MNHAAGLRAAEETSTAVLPSSSSCSCCNSAALPLSPRDGSSRPGSCCFLRGLRYYRLVGSLLSERESPHVIWRTVFCFLGGIIINIILIFARVESGFLPSALLAQFSSLQISDYCCVEEICWVYLWSVWLYCQMQVSPVIISLSLRYKSATFLLVCYHIYSGKNILYKQPPE